MIPITVEHTIIRLEADTPDWERATYGFPDFFGPGDGVVRFLIRPSIPEYHVHAVQLYARQTMLDDAEGWAWLKAHALVLASAFYQQYYGQPIEHIA